MRDDCIYGCAVGMAKVAVESKRESSEDNFISFFSRFFHRLDRTSD